MVRFLFSPASAALTPTEGAVGRDGERREKSSDSMEMKYFSRPWSGEPPGAEEMADAGVRGEP